MLLWMLLCWSDVAVDDHVLMDVDVELTTQMQVPSSTPAALSGLWPDLVKWAKHKSGAEEIPVLRSGNMV